MIIALVNSKGGVGKSTIAGNLAAWLYEQGSSVILADCDPQRSSSEWIRESIPGIDIIGFDNSDEVFEELPAISSQADYIIADGPGSQTETSRALLMWADLAIIPCKASMFEARALAKNTAFVRQAQAIRNGKPDAIAVLTMVGRDYRLTKDMAEAAKALDLSLASQSLTLRQAYADAPGQSTFVWHMGYSARDAADELQKLFQELLPEASGDNVVQMPKGRERATANK